MSSTVKIDVNANFHILYKKEGCIPRDETYRTYRRNWSEWPKNFVAGDFPLHLDIESTNLCNLRCPFCTFLIIHRKWKRGRMDWNLYQRVIDEGREHNLFSIKLSIRGEPLLHPDIIRMIEYAKKSGVVDVHFNTNGVLLTEEISKKLIEAGLDRVSVSFEGTTRELYEKNRVGADYKETIKNIKNLINCREKSRVNYPNIRIQTVLIPEMKGKLNEYKNFWKEKGVDEVAYLDLEQEPLENENLSYPWACPQLWQRMSIWYDGTILPCVHDTYGLMKIGNAKDLEIASVWKNEQEIFYRNMHRKGQGEKLRSCEICPLRAGQVRKLKEKENI